MARNRRPYKTGDFLSASWQNALKDELRRSRIIAGKGVRVTQKPHGQLVELDGGQVADFQITSGTQPYAGTQVDPVPGGGWTPRPGGITPTTTVDPLWERNGSTAVPAGSYVKAKRAKTTSEWIFMFGACS